MTVRRLSSSPIVVSSMLILINAMFNFIVNSVISIYAREYVGATVAEVGLIYAAWSILPMITVPLVGLYFYGSRLLFAPIMASIFLIASSTGMALAPSPMALAFFRVLQGLGNSLMWGPAMTLVALLSPDEGRNRLISRATLAGSVGLTLGPLLASANVALLGMRNNFLSAAVFAFISLLLSLTLIRGRVRLRDRLGAEGRGGLSLRDLPKIFKSDSLKIAFSAHFATASLFGILTAYGTLHSREIFALSGEEVSLIIFGYNFILMLGRIALIKLIDRVSRGRLLILGLASGLITLLGMFLVKDIVPYIMAFSLAGLAHSLVFPAGTMLIVDSTRGRALTFSNAIYMVAWDVGNILGPSISAPIAEIYGTSSAFIIAMISTAGPLSLITIMLRKKQGAKVPAS